MADFFDRIAVCGATSRPVSDVVALAKKTEEVGFDSFWLAEIYYWRSASPIAAAVGAATSRIKIGLSIVPTHTRHPSVIAMEAATLDEMTGGRFITGLGAAKRIAVNHG